MSSCFAETANEDIAILCIDGKPLEADDSRVRTIELRIRLLSALQLPLEHWHAWLQDPTLADAILDRLVHQAHKLPVNGDSMRRKTKSEWLTPDRDHRRYSALTAQHHLPD